MQILLKANRASGGGTDVDDLVATLLRHGATIVEDEDRAERVVVAGGDGSIAPGAELAARLDVPLAVVAAGTANDFARAHGLPLEIDEALRLAATGRATRRLELGRMEGRPFVNVASAGLAPAAAQRAEPLKKALGPLAYGAGAALAGAREQPIPVAATVDGERVFAGDAWQATVASSGAFGGGAEIDEADPADGRLDVVVVPEFSRAALARVAVAMRRGDLTDLEGVVHACGTAIELDVPPGTPFNVDGEVVEAGGRTCFTVGGGAFALVVG